MGSSGRAGGRHAPGGGLARAPCALPHSPQHAATRLHASKAKNTLCLAWNAASPLTLYLAHNTGRRCVQARGPRPSVVAEAMAGAWEPSPSTALAAPLFRPGSSSNSSGGGGQQQQQSKQQQGGQRSQQQAGPSASSAAGSGSGAAAATSWLSQAVPHLIRELHPQAASKSAAAATAKQEAEPLVQLVFATPLTRQLTFKTQQLDKGKSEKEVRGLERLWCRKRAFGFAAG